MARNPEIITVDPDLGSRAETKRAAQLAHFNVVAEAGYGVEAITVARENNCDLFLVSMEEPVALALQTIESLADGDRLHPVQQAFLETEAFQCGYCTPGMVMATIGLLKTHPNPTAEDIAKVMDRNVCRCGTYPRIVRAVQLAAERMRSTSLAGGRR